MIEHIIKDIRDLPHSVIIYRGKKIWVCDGRHFCDLDGVLAVRN